MGFKLTKKEYEKIKKFQEKTDQDIKKILVDALNDVLSDSRPFYLKRKDEKENLASIPRRSDYLKSMNKNKGNSVINH